MAREKITFKGAFGDILSARLNYPVARETCAWVLFAHGFSIGKDLKPARIIARTLVQSGFGMMRFDFTGLGESGGNFAETNFSSNVADILAAADWLRENYQAPAILIGHSFGGTAALKAAAQIPECKAVATIGSPFDPRHIIHQFADRLGEIEERGEAEVLLAGRPFVIKEQFLRDIAFQDMQKIIAELHRALMIFHSPQDRVVGIENASQIFMAARHPKSFVSLDRADHLLLKNPQDAAYIARVLAAWSRRYLKEAV